jgi:hypothetical protein
MTGKGFWIWIAIFFFILVPFETIAIFSYSTDASGVTDAFVAMNMQNPGTANMPMFLYILLYLPPFAWFFGGFACLFVWMNKNIKRSQEASRNG